MRRRLHLLPFFLVIAVLAACSSPPPSQPAQSAEEDSASSPGLRIAKDAGALLIENENVCFEILRSALTRGPVRTTTDSTWDEGYRTDSQGRRYRPVYDQGGSQAEYQTDSRGRRYRKVYDDTDIADPVRAYLGRDRRTEIVASTALLYEVEVLLDALGPRVPAELVDNLEAMFDLESDLCAKTNTEYIAQYRTEIGRQLADAAAQLPTLRRAIRQATGLTPDEQRVIVGRYRDPVRQALNELLRQDPELRPYLVDPFEPPPSPEEMAEKRAAQQARRDRQEEQRRALREKEAELRRELEERRREQATRAPQRVGLISTPEDEKDDGTNTGALSRALKQQAAPGPSPEAQALEAERAARADEVKSWYRSYTSEILPFKKALARFSQVRMMAGPRRARACTQLYQTAGQALQMESVVGSPEPRINQAMQSALTYFRQSANACLERKFDDMDDAFRKGEQGLGAAAQGFAAYGLSP